MTQVFQWIAGALTGLQEAPEVSDCAILAAQIPSERVVGPALAVAFHGARELAILTPTALIRTTYKPGETSAAEPAVVYSLDQPVTSGSAVREGTNIAFLISHGTGVSVLTIGTDRVHEQQISHAPSGTLRAIAGNMKGLAVAVSTSELVFWEHRPTDTKWTTLLSHTLRETDGAPTVCAVGTLSTRFAPAGADVERGASSTLEAGAPATVMHAPSAIVGFDSGAVALVRAPESRRSMSELDARSEIDWAWHAEAPQDAGAVTSVTLATTNVAVVGHAAMLVCLRDAATGTATQILDAPVFTCSTAPLGCTLAMESRALLSIATHDGGVSLRAVHRRGSDNKPMLVLRRTLTELTDGPVTAMAYDAQTDTLAVVDAGAHATVIDCVEAALAAGTPDMFLIAQEEARSAARA